MIKPLFTPVGLITLVRALGTIAKLDDRLLMLSYVSGDNVSIPRMLPVPSLATLVFMESIVNKVLGSSAVM